MAVTSVLVNFSSKLVSSDLALLLVLNYVLALSASEIDLNSALNNSARNLSRVEKCEHDTLNDCWNQLPPFPDQGIPSSDTGVRKACESFDTGMACVHRWTKRCLGEDARKKIEDSVRGAHEAFTFLCKDTTFQREFLSHADCYKKISPYWDDCANRFISTLKALSPKIYEDTTHLCCIRRNFKRCVSELAHFHCSKEASIFLLKMAETLVRTALRGNTPKPEMCDRPMIIQQCSGSAMLEGSKIIICLFFLTSLFLHRAKYRHLAV